MKPYDYLIVGSGLFGAVFAHEAHKAGRKCLVIEKRTHTGGNIYCEEVDGINVHKYGAHIFHTDNKEVWNYVNRLVEFNRYTNSPIANYKGKLYNLPFNMNTFYQLWGVRTPAEAKAKIQEQCKEYAHITCPQNLEEQALKLCGEDIYRQLIKDIRRSNGDVLPQSYRHLSSNASLSASSLIIITLTIRIRVFLSVVTTA